MSTAERRADPQILGPSPSAPATAAGMSPWLQLALKLRLRCSSANHEDDVQEALLRLFRRFGPEPSPEVALRLGGLMIFALRVDRARRPAQRPLGQGDALVPAGELDQQERQQLDVRRLDPSLATALGRKGVELLNALVDGGASTKRLARRLQTSPAAVRRRRARILRILSQWLREV